MIIIFVPIVNHGHYMRSMKNVSAYLRIVRHVVKGWKMPNETPIHVIRVKSLIVTVVNSRGEQDE